MNDFAPSPRLTIAGSERRRPAGAVRLGPLPGSERATVSVVIRPANPLPDASVGNVLSRADFAARFGASDADIAAVDAFARNAGLTVTGVDAPRRTMQLEGDVEALAAAFGTELATYRDADGREYRGRTGALSVPAVLGEIVRGVFGLDEREQARAHFRRLIRPAAAVSSGFTPIEVAAAYQFPPGDGRGQTIALIELGGGYTQSDLDTYFMGLGLATPSVVAVGVDGASNVPTGDPNGADAEVALDIEVAGAVAPGAKIVVYFAPNTDRGFLDAITTAIHDTTHAPNIVSISWGGPESTWTGQATSAFDDAFAAGAMLGVTIACAAGDGGSSDGLTDGRAHVDFPASSPHVLACGGTRLTLGGGAIDGESAWNDGSSGGATGGGVSDVFDLPVWQNAAGVPVSANAGSRVGRGVPDVSGNADPQTGYRTLVDGSTGVVGGTSAVAPLWSGLIARINANAGAPVGFANARLYGSPAALRDITSGDNGAYRAATGWDACTGLGSPNGPALATLFGATSTTDPTPIS